MFRCVLKECNDIVKAPKMSKVRGDDSVAESQAGRGGRVGQAKGARRCDSSPFRLNLVVIEERYLIIRSCSTARSVVSVTELPTSGVDVLTIVTPCITASFNDVASE